MTSIQIIIMLITFYLLTIKLTQMIIISTQIKNLKVQSLIITSQNHLLSLFLYFQMIIIIIIIIIISTTIFKMRIRIAVMIMTMMTITILITTIVFNNIIKQIAKLV